MVPAVGIVVGLASPRTNPVAVSSAIELGADCIEFAPHYAAGRGFEVAAASMSSSGRIVDIALKASPELLTSERSILESLIRRCRLTFGEGQPRSLLLHNPERLGGRASPDWSSWILALRKWEQDIGCEIGLAVWSLLEEVTPAQIAMDFAALGARLSIIESACSMVRTEAIRHRCGLRSEDAYEYWASGIFDGGWLPDALADWPLVEELGRTSAVDLCIATVMLSAPTRVVIAATSPERTVGLIRHLRSSTPFTSEARARGESLVEYGTKQA